MTAGNVSDFVPAKECIEAAPRAKAVIGDRGYGSGELRDFIKERGARPVIPPKKNRKVQYRYDKELYKTRNRAERFFCRLKDFRRHAAQALALRDRNPLRSPALSLYGGCLPCLYRGFLDINYES